VIRCGRRRPNSKLEYTEKEAGMSGTRLLILAIAALAPAAAACDDDEGPSDDATQFAALLSGDEEVPPVPTTASGTATFTVEDDAVTYTVNVTGLANPVVAHIHIGETGANGPVRLNLCGTGAPLPDCNVGDGVLVTGTNGTTVGTPAITFDELVEAMRSGGAYVNVHTDDGEGEQNTGPGDMASGEIRGQIVAE
jgi:hypothetical protein